MKSRYCFFWFSLLLLLTGCSEEQIFKRSKTKFKIGDQSEWATKDWPDRDWENRVELTDGRVFWSRTKIDILKTSEVLHPYGVRPYIYGEYEVFWDGVLIGKNGNPGREEELGPEGKMWLSFSIPSQLTKKGEHLLAIRSSIHYFPDHAGMFKLMLDEYDYLLTDPLRETLYMHVFAGVFLITSIYFLFLFLTDKKEYPTLIFSICCFLFFVLNLVESFTSYRPIHYSIHHVRLEVIIALTFGISFLIPLYFSLYFPFPKRKFVLIIYAVILVFLFSVHHNFTSFTIRSMALSMWLISFGIVVFGVYKKVKGARLVLLTLIPSILLPFFISYDANLFLGFSFTLLGMFYLLSLSIKEQKLAYENTLVQSTRLRLELLKKNIQPHFLMNTLTSLID